MIWIAPNVTYLILFCNIIFCNSTSIHGIFILSLLFAVLQETNLGTNMGGGGGGVSVDVSVVKFYLPASLDRNLVESLEWYDDKERRFR